MAESWAPYCTIKARASVHGCSNIPGGQKFMNNKYIQYPLKLSFTPPKSFSAFRSLFGNTKRVFFNHIFSFAQIVRTLGDSWARFFKNYITSSQKCFSTKISIWTCWDVGVEIPSDFRTSSLSNCLGKIVQIAIKRLSVRWRKYTTGINGSGVTLQLRDNGCTWCWFPRQKGLSVGSDKVPLNSQFSKFVQAKR